MGTVKYKTGAFLGGKFDEADFEQILNEAGCEG